MNQQHVSLTVSDVWVYPVKSLSGLSCKEARVTMKGFAYDRNWMVITNEGTFVTQRQIPAMAAIGVSLDEQHLELHAEGYAPCRISLEPGPQGELEDVVIHGKTEKGIREAEHVSRWLTEVLGLYKGSSLALVRFPTDHKRQVDPDFLDSETAFTAFADQYPFLVISEASLDALNEQLQARGKDPVPMNRFRPNIVVTGCKAFEEDTFSLLECNNGSVLELVKPCARCPITTVDQATGVKPDPREPLATLATFRKQGKGVMFGQNAIIHTTSNTIAVGETIQALKK